MKQLPFGIQTFKEIINNNYVYVDKTKDIYNLIENGTKYYFLSRPRRFGKSLLISTLKELFSGNKELFKDLWIYEEIDWLEHPIIHIDYSSMNHTTSEGLKKSILLRIDKLASEYQLELESNLGFKDKFKQLIEKLSEKGKVVILIDEYDKPIIDYINKPEVAKENRDVLKNLYETIKSCDEYIRFAFLTGVSKFAKVSVFSGLNNLQDITIDKSFSTMLGYTESELYSYFSEYINSLSKELDIDEVEIKSEIKSWYNGYSWDGEKFVYNPFSILALFSRKEFGNYWFSSGTPTFLIKNIRDHKINISELDNFEAVASVFDSFDIEQMNVYALLFQTGYLTIKGFNKIGVKKEYILSYPNLEVKESLTTHLLGDLTKDLNKSGILATKMAKSLNKNDIDLFIEQMKLLYSSIPYDLIIKDREAYYHTVFYLALTLTGVYIDCEVHTSKGRVDAIIKNKGKVYILEFKMGSASSAMKQIKDRGYY